MTDKKTKEAGFSGFDFASVEVTKESLAEFPIPQLPGSPVLRVRPATEANNGYFTERLRLTNHMKRSLGPNVDITTNTIQTNRSQERTLYGQHVVVGWTGMLDTNESEVDFSRDRATEFFAAIPAWIFDDISAFCREPSNFINSPLSVDGIVKN